MSAYDYSLDRSLSRVSKGPRANNCHGPRLALFRHCSRDPDHAHLGNTLITRLRLRMADPCTKFEVSSVSRCGEFTWDVKFYNGSPGRDQAFFREDF